jgi:hypothetical protein
MTRRSAPPELNRTWRSWEGGVGVLATEQAVEWTQPAVPASPHLSDLMPRLHFGAVSRFTAGLVRTHATRAGLVCRAVGRVPVLVFGGLPVERGVGRVVCRCRIVGGAFARGEALACRPGFLTLGVTWTPSESPGEGGVRCRAWARVEGFPSRFLAPTERPGPVWRAVGAMCRTFHAHVVFAYLRRLATELAAERG